MEIVFLGTGSAVPTIARNHPSVFLKYGNENILFDCGEGTQKQFRKAGLNPCKLTKLFITHWHGDHILGIPGLLQTLALNNYPKSLEIYGPKGTKYYMQRILDMFVHRGKINVNVNEVENGKIIETGDFIINAEKMDHDTPCMAYSFIEKDKLRIDKNKLKKLKLPHTPLLQEIKKGKDVVINKKKIKAKDITYLEKGKKFSIALDTRINSNILKIAKNSDVFVCESTYLDEGELAKNYGHMTASQAAGMAKKANVKKLFLMHLSQKYEKNTKAFLNTSKKIFKNSFIAEDLMKVGL